MQAITLAWMSLEAAVSLFAAWRARSPVLLAFGGDSAIELASAVVMLWRFRTGLIKIGKHFNFNDLVAGERVEPPSQPF